MIGTSHDEVEARLLRAEQDCELQESIVQEGRPELPDGRSAPLTITQLDDLLGDRSNQTRVVLGTSATGVTDVGDTLRTVAGRIADWKLPPVGNARVYRQEITGGVPRERRVVISDFANYPARPEACREAVDQAETLLPGTSGVTRAVVPIADHTTGLVAAPVDGNRTHHGRPRRAAPTRPTHCARLGPARRDVPHRGPPGPPLRTDRRLATDL
ncbi:hypothetical protein [Streptomyces phaeochromogenes]|uniref:hypothetical protein n=1 Tax=Streptomyces phaeochromogenes TaxID=1923 RepID=UPI0038697864|nr:hypothetical protein OG277_01865 [Streptomyces phaeochromogenes]